MQPRNNQDPNQLFEKKDFLYLFLIDPARIIVNDHYEKYVGRETGYGKSLLQAYQYALTTPILGMTEGLLNDIHRIAMSHLPDANPGQYKEKPNSFAVTPSVIIDPNSKEICKNCTFSVTHEGIQEFIDYWLLGKIQPPFHYIAFQKKNDPLTGFIVCVEEGKLFIKEIKNKKIIKKIELDKNNLQRLYTLLKDFSYSCEVNSMPAISSPGEMKQCVTLMLKRHVDEYNDEIKKATSENKKISTIVKHTQRIAQLHAFKDGNIRTCYVLLNKLLKENHLSLSIMLDPNRLDMCHIDLIVRTVKCGQEIYNQLMHLNSSEKKFTVTTEEEFDFMKSITFSKQPLYDIDENTIIDFVITLNKVNLIEKFDPLTNSLNLFSIQKNPIHTQLLAETEEYFSENSKYKSIYTALEKSDYVLALRNACINNLVPLILILLKFKDSFNINDPSKNGNTVLDWLELSTIGSPESKDKIRALLIENGALTKEQIVKRYGAS